VLGVAIIIIDAPTWETDLPGMIFKMFGALGQHNVETIFADHQRHEDSSWCQRLITSDPFIALFLDKLFLLGIFIGAPPRDALAGLEARKNVLEAQS